MGWRTPASCSQPGQPDSREARSRGAVCAGRQRLGPAVVRGGRCGPRRRRSARCGQGLRPDLLIHQSAHLASPLVAALVSAQPVNHSFDSLLEPRSDPCRAGPHSRRSPVRACGHPMVPALSSYVLGTVDTRPRAGSGQRGDGRHAQPEGQDHEQRKDKSARGGQLRLRRPRSSVGTDRRPGVAGNCAASSSPQDRRWVLSECAHESDLPSNKSPSVSIPSISVIGSPAAPV